MNTKNQAIQNVQRIQKLERELAKETAKVAELRMENEIMYACILEAAELSGTGAARCKVELQRIAREEAKQ